IAAAARTYVGTPYSWGGGTTKGPSPGIAATRGLDGSTTVGFDCSGLVLYAVHEATGITLGRTAGAQVLDSRGTRIDHSLNAMKPGDVIGFSPSGSAGAAAIEHDGIYIGDAK